MKNITTIKTSDLNDTYMIAYLGGDGEISMDYTTNLMELKVLLEFHEKNTEVYSVYKVKKNESAK
jgi:hypothetical protein